MTGKQCIFSPQLVDVGASPNGVSLAGDKPPHQIPPEDLKVFVVMPFKPNLETFYRWSLKRYLVKGYGLPEDNVQRADEVRDIGYIVCEKICRKIQEADLTLIEVSNSNANVFYEAGLAYGLERPVVLMRNGNSANWQLDNCAQQSLRLRDTNAESRVEVMSYPGIEKLDLTERDEHQLHKYIFKPTIPKGLTRKLKISVLNVERSTERSANTNQSAIDIDLDFKREVLPGVVGVVMQEIREDWNQREAELKREKKLQDLEPHIRVGVDIPSHEWDEFATADILTIDGRTNFKHIAEVIERSFCTIIDVSGNDPVACFWLGYCHARGLNAIPVYRLGSAAHVEHPDLKSPQTADESSETPEEEDDRLRGRVPEPRLAFDIRALWYAEYDSKKSYEFKDKMREILDHLLERDLPDRQKRAFWDRFPAELPIKVFTGAIHNHSLNREMVGDWDVRTVSELFSYLPAIREASTIELVTPLYSPEQAYAQWEADPKNKSVKNRQEAFTREYREGIKSQLEHCCAIVIASPDVNPVTEYLLNKVYKVKAPPNPFDPCKEPNFNGYVVLKQTEKAEEKAATNIPVFPRYFYQIEHNQQKEQRGFAIQSRVNRDKSEQLMREYFSQNDASQDFKLLGHLVVAYYPPESNNLIVLLNGVSGPATFALAQILTGGGQRAKPGMQSDSEQMLLRINKALDQPGCSGVEAIVEISIVGRQQTTYAVDITYTDSRDVASWQFIAGLPPRGIQLEEDDREPAVDGDASGTDSHTPANAAKPTNGKLPSRQRKRHQP